MEDDEGRSEATFRFMVQNLKNLKETALSAPCYVRHLPWRIEVMPREMTSSDKQKRKSLGIFLQCNGESTCKYWSCFAKAELKLISQKVDTEPLGRKIEHSFCSKENDWGFSHFIAWDDVLNPNRGFIKDNEITVEVHIIADMPVGVTPFLKQRTGCIGDVAHTTIVETRDNNLAKGPNGSDVTHEPQGSSAQNNSETQDLEHSTTEEPLQEHATTEALANSNCTVTYTSAQQSTDHQQNVADENPVLNVLQRVESILSSLLNTTQQQYNIVQQQNLVPTEKDEFHYFARSVAAQLRKLPAHIAVDTLNKIQGTLSTARLTSMFSNTPAASSSSHT